MRRKPIIALIYDFDGTLSPGNMQEFGFIQAIGSTPEEFWSKSDGIAKGQDASNILAYMKLMYDEARKNGIRLTREDFRRYGSDIVLFDGVREWFRNVNEYGQRHGVIIEHYINSSGLKEIIEGSPIAKEFKHIFAGSFIYDEAGEAEWPGIAVDFTAKTQFLFKIQKGIFSSRDAKRVNESMAEDEKRIPFHQHDLLRRRRDRHPLHEGREHVRRQLHRRVQSGGSPQARIGPKTPEAGPRELHHAGCIQQGIKDFPGGLRHHRQDQSG